MSNTTSLPNLRLPLFITRILIAYFLSPWVLMRFTSPEAAKGIAGKYYQVSNLPDIANTAIGVLWVVLLVAFVIGFKKRISYGLVALFHGIGTAFTIPYLIPGMENFAIIFLAALPTFCAMVLLYILRDHDTLLNVDARGA